MPDVKISLTRCRGQTIWKNEWLLCSFTKKTTVVCVSEFTCFAENTCLRTPINRFSLLKELISIKESHLQAPIKPSCFHLRCLIEKLAFLELLVLANRVHLKGKDDIETKKNLFSICYILFLTDNRKRFLRAINLRIRVKWNWTKWRMVSW